MKRLLSIRIHRADRRRNGGYFYVWSDHGGWGGSVGKSWIHALMLALKGE